MPRKETKVLIAIIFLFDLGLLVFWILIFSFTRNQITDTSTKENQIKIELIKRDTAYLMKTDIKNGMDYEKNLDSYIVGKENVADLIKTVDDLAASSNLKASISSINYESSDTLSALGMEYVRINMNTTGNWKNTHLFINLLEAYPLKISIKNVSLNEVSAAGTAIPVWSGVFDFTVIKFK